MKNPKATIGEMLDFLSVQGDPDYSPYDISDMAWAKQELGDHCPSNPFWEDFLTKAVELVKMVEPENSQYRECLAGIVLSHFFEELIG